MERLRRLQSLAHPSDTKILMFVLDGVGGVPHPETGQTELEAARIPRFDAFAKRASCGRTVPFGLGVAPGSGPGHLALFGYPNDQVELNRGVLEVLGAEEAYRNGRRLEQGYTLGFGDVAARGNWARVDADTLVVRDRRAGLGLSDAENAAVVRRLSEQVRLDGVEVTLFPGRQHRFAVAFRGPGLGGSLVDTDPQDVGLVVVQPEARGEAARTAEVVAQFMAQVHELLPADAPMNYPLLRGIGGPPSIPTLEELYGIRCACLATYPMYRGIARLVGMSVLEAGTHEAEVAQLEAHFDAFDFFYLHIKETDSYGHKGDFRAKVGVLEEVDPLFQRCVDLGFDVIVVTGDHSTPTAVTDHTYHPVPTMVWSRLCLADEVDEYSERRVHRGTLGTIDARDLLPVALAEAGRLKKYGA